ncbi:hypothetical protein [Coprothermobacter platensis]|uniref:hypothetical protein n=1 Tax=Coprothermobacter platensis TaxID=108819 RepID=UPI00036D0A58|nr:hypothetical protein [Coprothermobacter platensis]
MGRIAKVFLAVFGIICLFAAGSFAENALVESSKPVYTVLLPYETYMGNLWQVEELPDILQAMNSEHVVALVYYPFQDVDKIIQGLSTDVILVSNKPITSDKRVLWVNIGTFANDDSYLDLSYETLLTYKGTMAVIQNKKLCAKDELMALTNQYLWSKTQGVFSAQDCPSDALFIGYGSGSSHKVIAFDVKASIQSLVKGQRIRKVVQY